MAKWFGKIGFAEQAKTAPGVYTDEIVFREYYGDVIRNTRRLQSTDQVNDDISISNEISIVADPYAMNNFHSMRWVELMGTKWKAVSVDVQHPRLIISLGEVWNGD